MKIGFIGLGRMGAAMAANLVRAGHDVTVFNRSPEKRRALLELGAREAGSVADACHGEVIITMLADDTAVADVALAKYGIVESLARGAIHLSMSTISVALSKKLSEAHAHAGQRFVPAPAYKTYGGLIAEGSFQPAAFAAPLGFKDIGLALQAAESLRVPMPLASLLHDRFLRLLAQGGDSLDWSAIGGLAAQDAGAA